MKTKVLIMLSVTILLVSGCFSSKPSESKGKEVLKNKLTSSAKILSFEKTNGQKLMNDNYYLMDFKATVSYPKGLNLQCKNFKGLLELNPKKFSRCAFVSEVIDRGGKVKYKGKIYFKKTEKGWIAYDFYKG